jgi:hypothetical protein
VPQRFRQQRLNIAVESEEQASSKLNAFDPDDCDAPTFGVWSRGAVALQKRTLLTFSSRFAAVHHD